MTRAATNVTIVDADLSRDEHQKALVTMLDSYMRDPMEGGEPPSEQVKRDLLPGPARASGVLRISRLSQRRASRLFDLLPGIFDLHTRAR